MNPRVINVVVTANTSLLSAGLARGSRQILSFVHGIERAAGAAGGALTRMQIAGAAAGIALVAGFAASAGAAVQFEQRMRNVNSLLKLNEGQLAGLSAQALELSRRFPQSANQVADAFYDIASAGFKAEEAIKISEAAAVAASAGLTDMATAVRAINAVINAFGYSADDANHIADVLFQTVNVGIVTFEQLATQLGDVVGTAAAVGLEIDEVGAAIATMTRSGLGADEAVVSLNRLLQSLVHPTNELRHIYEFLGYESGALAVDTLGLKTVMEQLGDAVGGDITALLSLFPEIRSSRGAFALLANEGETYIEVADAISNAQNVAGAATAAYNEQMKGTAQQWVILKNNAGAVAIEFGNSLLPVLKGGIDILGGLVAVGGGVINFIQKFTDITAILVAGLIGRFVPAMALGIWYYGGLAKAALVAAAATFTAGSGVGRFTGMFSSLAGAIGPANVAMLGFAAAAGALVFISKAVSNAIRGNNDEIAALSQTAEDAIHNIDAIWASIAEQDVDISFWENLWASLGASSGVSENVEATHRLKDFQQELARLSELSATAAFELLRVAEAAGDIHFDEDLGAYLVNPNGRFARFEGATGFAVDQTQTQELVRLLEAQQDAAASASDEVRALEEQTGQSAREMSAALGMPLEAFVELVEGARRAGDEVRDAFLSASSAIANFDPTNPFQAYSLTDVLQGEYDSTRTNNVEASGAFVDAMRAEEDAAIQLQDAELNLADAQNAVGRAAANAAQAQEDAARRIADAERNLADAHHAVGEAQEGLNEARQRAAERIEELQQALEDQADSEEKGLIGVARARAALARLNLDEAASPLARREAQIALREAERGLNNTQDTNRDTAQELAEAIAAGIEGSREVLDAQEALEDAEYRVAQAIQSVSDAHAAAAQAGVDGARAVADAIRGVEQAQRSVGEAQLNVSQAAGETADAWARMNDAAAAFTEAQLNLENPARMVALMYDEMLGQSEAFLDGIQELTERGLDSSLIAELLAAGPEEAMPIIQAMLADNSGRLVDLASQAEGVLRGQADTAADIAAATHRAVMDETDALDRDLARAMDIIRRRNEAGATASIESIYLVVGRGAAAIARIANEFGIAIASALNPGLEAVGAPLIPAGVGMVSTDYFTPLNQAEGGFIPMMPGAQRGKDSIAARLMPHEFVEPVHAVDYYGVGAFEALRKHRVPREVLKGYAQGGLVEEGTPPPGVVGTMGGGVSYPYGQGPSNMGNSTFGGVKPWVAWSGNLLRAIFGISDIGGVGSRSNPSDHPSGHALDYMTYANKFLGDRIVGFLVRNAVEHSIKYLIWQQQINSGSGWRRMEDRGSITQNHFDHVHASYMARALMGRAMSGMPEGAFFLDLPMLPDFGKGTFADYALQLAAYSRSEVERRFNEQYNGGFIGTGGPVEPGTNRAMGQRLNAARGWGAHWNSLDYLWEHESNWNNVAQNPTSTAFGIAQFLDSTWGTVGHTKTSDPYTQIMAGLDYIAQRPDYRNPTEALRMWQSRSPHWYALGGLVAPGSMLNPHVRDSGGPLRPGFTFNGTGGNETVVRSGGLFPDGAMPGVSENLANLANLLEDAVADAINHGADDLASTLETIFPNLVAIMGTGASNIIEVIREGLNSEQLVSGLQQAIQAGSDYLTIAIADALDYGTTSIAEQLYGQGIASQTTTDSGVVNAVAAGADTSSAGIRQAIEDIEALQEAWEASADAADETARRDELWRQRQIAQGVVDEMVSIEGELQVALDATAEGTEERTAAELALSVATDARIEAEQQLGSSIDAIIQLDVESAQAAEDAAIANTLATLAIQERLAANREAYDFENLLNGDRLAQIEREMSLLDEGSQAYEDLEAERHQVLQRGLADQIANLDDRIAAEEKFSDEWIQLTEDRAQLEGQLLDDMYQQAADAIQARDELVDSLNDLLDRRQEILERMGELEVEGRSDLNDRIIELEEDLNRQLLELREQRARSLSDAFNFDEELVVRWGSSVSEIIRNAREQVTQWREWVAGVAQLESMGFSQDVLMAMGVYNGPEELHQIEMLAQSTQQQVADLNALIAEQQGIAADQAGHEYANQVGILGAQMLAARQQLADQLAEMQVEFEESFVADMAELTEELKNLGLDQGRTYIESLNEGMGSGLEGLEIIVGQILALANTATTAVATANAAAAGQPGSTNVALGGKGGILRPGLGTYQLRTTSPTVPTSVKGSGDVYLAVSLGDREVTELVRVETMSVLSANKRAVRIATGGR